MQLPFVRANGPRPETLPLARACLPTFASGCSATTEATLGQNGDLAGKSEISDKHEQSLIQTLGSVVKSQGPKDEVGLGNATLANGHEWQ